MRRQPFLSDVAAPLDCVQRALEGRGRKRGRRHGRRAALLRSARSARHGDHTFVTVFFQARDAGGRVWAPKSLVRRLRNRGVDVLLGAGAKPRPTDAPLRLCPARWVAPGTLDDLKASLRPLLELPVEQVLVSHGAPVLQDPRHALAAVLE